MKKVDHIGIAVTGEKISSETLGGLKVHNPISGNAYIRGKDEEAVLQSVRQLLSYLPQNNEEKLPILPYENESDYRPDLVKII